MDEPNGKRRFWWKRQDKPKDFIHDSERSYTIEDPPGTFTTYRPTRRRRISLSDIIVELILTPGLREKWKVWGKLRSYQKTYKRYRRGEPWPEDESS